MKNHLAFRCKGLGYFRGALVAALLVAACGVWGETRVGIIGVDTSHAIAFTEMMNVKKADFCAGFRVTCAYKWGSRDIASSTNRYAAYIPKLEGMGVKMVPSIAELLKNVDCVLLETNDGRAHLAQAQEVFAAGKRVFIDKPITASFADAVKLVAAGKAANAKWFSSSSLRYVANAVKARKGEFGKIRMADITSPSPFEAQGTHSDYYWYGIHGFEPVMAIMGRGVKDVTCVRAPDYDVVTGRWADGRVGVVRLFRRGGPYSGSIIPEKGKPIPFGTYEGYEPLLREIIAFFKTGVVPVDNDETLELFAFMEAAAISAQRGGKAVSLDEVFAKARLEDAAIVVPPAKAPPPMPGIESWGFRKELAQSVTRVLKQKYRFTDEYGLKGNLETVCNDLQDFVGEEGPELKLVKGKVDGFESYRLDVAANGNVLITAEDDAGIRRAVYYFEDRVQAGDLKTTQRKPWVRNRISRCFFGPIKRPPLFHDELMDDIDYYPDAYLNRLAHEGVNGLWLTVEWLDLAHTSFAPPSPDAEKRLAKLRKTVDKCLRYGIKTWIFAIEPHRQSKDSYLYTHHPDMFGAALGREYVLCPSTEKARKYIEESLKDIFTRVPGLGGMMCISHGERPTTCLSTISPVNGVRAKCPRCGNLEPWQVHCLTAESMVRGMRAVNPEAEFISWFYQPQVPQERAAWVAEAARHVPEGITFAYNFESGAVRNQLGRLRAGGDYWLSYTGPSEAFRHVSDAAQSAHSRLGAKIQVCNSHEIATVPFVPVPGLLYQKYKAMKNAGVSTVLQCWYFGNYPGTMNKAAGELSFDDFTEDEDAFLERLAASEWGADAKAVAKLWRAFSDAYAEYPLSNDMQYYGPFHAGVAWPLYPYLEMKPLGRTWKPLDAPSGDTIGECLENHSLDEALLLARRMQKKSCVVGADGKDILDTLQAKYAGNRERLLDIGVIKALKLHFDAAVDIFSFYRDRAEAVEASRLWGDNARARAALKRMRATVIREKGVSQAMLPLCENDSRLGFHSEAECHQYHPAKLQWRLGELDRALKQIDVIDAMLAAGNAYPQSEFEKNAPTCVVGGAWVEGKDVRFRVRTNDLGDFIVDFEAKAMHLVDLITFDQAGTLFQRHVMIAPSGKVTTLMWFDNVVTPSHETSAIETHTTKEGWKGSITLSASAWDRRAILRPGWLRVSRGWNTTGWPNIPPVCDRLNLRGQVNTCGRIEWPK